MTLFDIDVFKFDLNVLELVNLPMIGLMIMASSSVVEVSDQLVLTETISSESISLPAHTCTAVLHISAHFVLVKSLRSSNAGRRCR